MTFNSTATQRLSRRGVIGGCAAAGGLLLLGCSASGESQPAQPRESGAASRQPSAGPASMTVYRDPSCGCCESWAAIARQAGYEVSLRDDQDMPAVKKRLGVPEQLASCHTAVVDDMVIEGHVPLEQVKRLLREKPAGVRGIAVPGMPAGSPGMEVPDGTKEPYQVIAFDQAGRTSVFATSA